MFKKNDPISLAANSRGGKAGSREAKAAAGRIGGRMGDRAAKAAGGRIGGAIGGKVMSDAKLTACRENAKKAGRKPHKNPSKMAEYKRKSRERLKSKNK